MVEKKQKWVGQVTLKTAIAIFAGVGLLFIVAVLRRHDVDKPENAPASAFSSSDAVVRMQAIKSLNASTAEPAAPQLIRLLRDSDVQVRLAAAEALTHLGKKAIPALVAALRNPDSSDFLIGRDGLHIINCDLPKTVQGLAGTLASGSDVLTRRKALEALSMMGPKAKDAVPAIIALLSVADFESMELSEAIQTLGNIGPDAKDAVPVIIPFLKFEKTINDEQRKGLAHLVSSAAAYALAMIDPSCAEAADAAQIMAMDLKTKTAAITLDYIPAIKGLTSIGDGAIPVMIDAYQDANELHRP